MSNHPRGKLCLLTMSRNLMLQLAFFIVHPNKMCSLPKNKHIVFSASHISCAPVPWPSWWPCVGFASVCPCLSCTRSPKHDTVLQAWSHKHRNHLSHPADYSFASAAQSICLIRDTLLVHSYSCWELLTGTSGLFLQSKFACSRFWPACPAAWACSITAIGLLIWPCSTPWGFSQLIFKPCPAVLFRVWCYMKACREHKVTICQNSSLR